jgi:hypothetical protein
MDPHYCNSGGSVRDVLPTIVRPSLLMSMVIVSELFEVLDWGDQTTTDRQDRA